MKESRIRSIVKSVSWRIGGSLITSVIVFALTRKWGISFTAGVADLISKLIIFYVHERVWERIRWGRRAGRDAHLRSLGKALSYRICGSLATSIIVFFLTDTWALSLTAGAADFVLKLLVFYAHERVWGRIDWGQLKPE